MEGDREGIPGLRGGVSKGTERANPSTSGEDGVQSIWSLGTEVMDSEAVNTGTKWAQDFHES